MVKNSLEELIKKGIVEVSDNDVYSIFINTPYSDLNEKLMKYGFKSCLVEDWNGDLSEDGYFHDEIGQLHVKDLSIDSPRGNDEVTWIYLYNKVDILNDFYSTVEDAMYDSLEKSLEWSKIKEYNQKTPFSGIEFDTILQDMEVVYNMDLTDKRFSDAEEKISMVNEYKETSTLEYTDNLAWTSIEHLTQEDAMHEVYYIIQKYLESKENGLENIIYTNLYDYFETIVDEIEELGFEEIYYNCDNSDAPNLTKFREEYRNFLDKDEFPILDNAIRIKMNN